MSSLRICLPSGSRRIVDNPDTQMCGTVVNMGNRDRPEFSEKRCGDSAPLAGKSTLNRLEHAPTEGPDRYHKMGGARESLIKPLNQRLNKICDSEDADRIHQHLTNTRPPITGEPLK